MSATINVYIYGEISKLSMLFDSVSWAVSIPILDKQMVHDHIIKSVVAQWLTRWSLELEALGLIPSVGKGISVSKHAFIHVICRHDIKPVSLPSDWNDSWRPPVHGKSSPVQLKELKENLKREWHLLIYSAGQGLKSIFDHNLIKIVTCRPSSCNPEYTMYTCLECLWGCMAVYKDR